MTLPLVSAIVPVYNVEPYLDRCIESLINQTYQNLEIILVDDGSTDRSGRLCDAWGHADKRVRVFHKENGGLSDARNYGIQKAAGQLLTFVDSDDVVSSDCFGVLYKLLTDNDCDFAFSANFVKFTEESGPPVFSPRGTPVVCVYTQQEFADIYFRFNGNRTVHYACGKLFKRDILTGSQFPKGMLNEDVEGTFKALIRSKRIVETSQPLYGYFSNPVSITSAAFGNNYLNLSEVWARVYRIAKEEKPEYANAAKYNCMRADFTILCEALLRGNEESDAEYSAEITEHIMNLKANLSALLMGRMALNRKFFVVVLAYFYRPVKLAIRTLQRIERH